jgi:hypothetical protein
MLVAHLGHIKIFNAAVDEEKSKLFLKRNLMEEKHPSDHQISDSTKFTLHLCDTSLFSIDTDLENQEQIINPKSYNDEKLSQLSKQTLNNNFRIFYLPKFAEKIIDKTNIEVNFDYMPKFKTDHISQDSLTQMNDNKRGFSMDESWVI